VKLEAEGLSLFVRLEFWLALDRESARLAKGADLDEEEVIDLVIAAKATEAEARGASLLSRAEQPRYLLRAKLVERGFPDRAVALALDRLEAEGLLDDRRYAEAWLRSRVGKAVRSAAGRGGRAEGPSSLILSIKTRGVADADAKAALAEVLDADTRPSLLEAAIGTLRREGLAGEGLRQELRSLGWGGDELRESLNG
jgi:regulatory protein